MVEKFRQLLEAITHDKGPVYLFAIMKMDDLTDKWTILLSAPWATSQTHEEAFGLVFGWLSQNLNQEERNNVARIGIFEQKNHLIAGLLKYRKDTIITNEKINGNLVHEAHILES